jgi:hypothetical protein
MCTHVWVARCWAAAERTVATRNWPGLPRPFACWSATRPLIFTRRVEQNLPLRSGHFLNAHSLWKILLILYNFSRWYVRPQKRSIRSHFRSFCCHFSDFMYGFEFRAYFHNSIQAKYGMSACICIARRRPCNVLIRYKLIVLGWQRIFF